MNINKNECEKVLTEYVDGIKSWLKIRGNTPEDLYSIAIEQETEKQMCINIQELLYNYNGNTDYLLNQMIIFTAMCNIMMILPNDISEYLEKILDDKKEKDELIDKAIEYTKKLMDTVYEIIGLNTDKRILYVYHKITNTYCAISIYPQNRFKWDKLLMTSICKVKKEDIIINKYLEDYDDRKISLFLLTTNALEKIGYNEVISFTGNKNKYSEYLIFKSGTRKILYVTGNWLDITEQERDVIITDDRITKCFLNTKNKSILNTNIIEDLPIMIYEDIIDMNSLKFNTDMIRERLYGKPTLIYVKSQFI